MLLLYRELKRKHWTYPCEDLNPQTGENDAVCKCSTYAHFRPLSEEIIEIVFKLLSFSHL